MKRCAMLFLLLAWTAPVTAQRTSYEELQTFSAMLQQIRISYVDSVGQAELVRGAIAGTLSVLDPHSVYLRAATLDRLTAARSGLAATIGARLDHDGADVVVLTVGTGSPAARGGLRPGDRLLAVNDTPAVGLSSEEAEALLAGDDGSPVRLRVARGPRAAPGTLTIGVERKLYRWPAVPVALLTDSTTGYVRLEEFAEGSARELEKAVKKLRSEGARRLVLDLRGNPGGLVGEATRLAGLFLPKDAIIAYSVGRNGKATAWRGEGGPFGTLPLAVLIDEGSASASEIVAAALQDHDRALIAGTRSFGKALMQVQFPLPSGDAVALTIARIESPARRKLQREFRGLSHKQYYEMAGTSGKTPGDSLRSLGGRPLDGGPGVAPDTTLPASAEPPAWWGDALEAGLDLAVARDAAATLQGTAQQWRLAEERWGELADRLLKSMQARIPAAALEPGQRPVVARALAARVARLSWGDVAADHFLVLTDPAAAAAARLFR